MSISRPCEDDGFIGVMDLIWTNRLRGSRRLVQVLYNLSLLSAHHATWKRILALLSFSTQKTGDGAGDGMVTIAYHFQLLAACYFDDFELVLAKQQHHLGNNSHSEECQWCGETSLAQSILFNIYKCLLLSMSNSEPGAFSVWLKDHKEFSQKAKAFLIDLLKESVKDKYSSRRPTNSYSPSMLSPSISAVSSTAVKVGAASCCAFSKMKWGDVCNSKFIARKGWWVDGDVILGLIKNHFYNSPKVGNEKSGLDNTTSQTSRSSLSGFVMYIVSQILSVTLLNNSDSNAIFAKLNESINTYFSKFFIEQQHSDRSDEEIVELSPTPTTARNAISHEHKVTIATSILKLMRNTLAVLYETTGQDDHSCSSGWSCHGISCSALGYFVVI